MMLIKSIRPNARPCVREKRALGLLLFAFAAAFFAVQPSPKAVLFYSTGDPAYNTTEPGGALTNSGWQYEGRWNSFLGTAIASRYFITAKHVGGVVGDAFVLNGTAYCTTDYFDHPQSDLRIWRVKTSMPTAAPLYSRSDEAGKSLIVIGRGTQRGEAFSAASRFGHEAKGWLWGSSDGIQRWGENKVSSIYQDPVSEAFMLKTTFDAGSGANEATLSVGDSGGAIFIQDAGVWKLAGINYAVDGPFNTNDTGGGFQASLFDKGGLYEGGGDNWILRPETFFRQPGGFYSTRISSYLDWINQILNQTIPSDGPSLASSASLNGPFTTETNTVTDEAAQTIRIPAPQTTRFYLLLDSSQRSIRSISREGDSLVIGY